VSLASTEVLGGGLFLGSVTLLEEDRLSDHVMTLARYFLAEGVAAGHTTLVVGAVSLVHVKRSPVSWSLLESFNRSPCEAYVLC
jgi:hypothetical protein